MVRNDSAELKSRIDSLMQKIKHENRLVNRVCEIGIFELPQTMQCVGIFIFGLLSIVFIPYRQSMKYYAGRLVTNYRTMTGKQVIRDSPGIDQKADIV